MTNVPPEYVLAPVSVKVPLPAFVRLSPAPAMAPPTVRLPQATVTVRLPPRVTAPLPRFNPLGPLKTKSPFQFCTLLAASVMGPPLVLPSVPPLIARVPPPSAEGLLTFSAPALSCVPPL